MVSDIGNFMRTEIEIKRSLMDERNKILALAPEKALDAILEYPHPAALIHSFPEEDFHILIHEIGVGDSLELLSLASVKQWEYILDVEIWDNDRISLPSLSKWLDLLIKSDIKRFTEWILDEKSELIEYYLYNTLEVGFREHDQDPSDFPEDFYTLDDTIYIRIKPNQELDGFEKIISEHRRDFISTFIEKIVDSDYGVYQKLLFESAGIIPSESEEHHFRLRNVRLAEKGFLHFDEAVGIYQPLKSENLKKQNPKYLHPDNNGEVLTYLPIPQYPSGELEQDNIFSRSLQAIDIEDILFQLQTEFANLCNMVVSADNNTIRSRDELNKIVKKTCGYLSIGLEQLSEGKTETNQTAALIQKYPLLSIFRVGFGMALDLKWQASQWHKNSWFKSKNIPLSFWDEEGMGILGGLLIKKPLFFDNYTTAELYREFETVNDVITTEKKLEEIVNYDSLFKAMDFPGDLSSQRFLTFKQLILTLWAREILKLESPNRLIPLSKDEFIIFFAQLMTGKEPQKHIDDSMKSNFLSWVSKQTGESIEDIGLRMGKSFEELFKEIENELGSVSEKHLDPRYIRHFLVKSPISS